MTINLPWAYTPDLAPPRSPMMAFYAPTQPAFLFQAGDMATIVCQPITQRALALSWELCRNGLTTPLRRGQTQPGFDNSFAIEIDTATLLPGMYDLRVRIELGHGEDLTGITAFGWRVLEERLPIVEPDGFIPYWRETLMALRRPALDLRITPEFTLRGAEIDAYNREHACLPEHYDRAGETVSEVSVYSMDFAAPGWGRIYGRFARPAQKGCYPGLLVLPGAGNRARPAPVEHARHGYTALDIQVHGFPTDLAEYPSLPELDTYESIEGYSHYEVYRNTLRAVDALLALPGVDADRVAVAGGSQGGRLAIVAAALDNRIRAAVPALTHFAHRPFVRWAEQRNALGDSGEQGFTDQDIPDDVRTRIEAFFDVVNFAPLVRCPVLLNAGLIDPISPPSTIFALYRCLCGPKEIRVMPNHGHDWSAAFERYAWQWLRSALETPLEMPREPLLFKP